VRLEWFSTAAWLDGERIAVYPKIFAVVFIAASVLWWAIGDGLLDPRGEPLGTDFISFWTASRLALQGEPAAAYDIARHHAAEIATVGGAAIPYYAWFYPPMFLAIVLPLALLPYGWSLLAWLSLTLAGYLAVLRRIAPYREAVWLAAAFPAVFVNAGHGQNGFLSAALLGAALLLLDRRPMTAGIVIALMTFKPQLGLLIPLALIADGRWQSFFSAAGASIAFAAATWLMFGSDTWSAFLAQTAMAGQTMEQGIVGWAKMQSSFAAIRLLGGGLAAGYAGQAAVTVAAAAAVIWLWRQPIGLPLKGAGLAAATLLATPFVLDYDLMLLALPIAWLAVEGLRSGFRAGEKLVLAACWLLPLLSRLAGETLGLPLAPPIIGALLAMIVLRAAATRTADAASDKRAVRAAGPEPTAAV